MASVAFVTAVPTTRLRSWSLIAGLHVLPAVSDATHSASVSARRKSLPTRQTPHAGLLDDFLSGPSTPPRPRPLSQVVLFSLVTGLLYYGVYKFIVEEDLKSSGAGGKGGFVALGPFVAGAAAPLFLPPTEGFSCFALGLAWILYIQFTLHQRVNALCRESGLGEPLELWWTFVPPFNILVGLRGIHFLSQVYGAGDDYLADKLPWVTMPKVDALELLRSPNLWVNLAGDQVVDEKIEKN